jgi:hypothetical protein
MKFIKKIIFIIVLAISMTLYACNGGAYTYNLSNTSEKTKIEKTYILYPFGNYRMSISNGDFYSYETGCYKIQGDSINFTPKKSEAYSGKINNDVLNIKSEKYTKM